MTARSDQMKFAGRALSLLAEMQDSMDDALRALENDDMYRTRTCMALITIHADEILNLLNAAKGEEP